MREFCLIFLLAVIVFSTIQILTYREQKRMNKEQVKLMESNIQFDLAEIVATFETFIDIIMDRYLRLNPNYIDNNKYINADEEEVLLREISSEVMKEISPFLIHRLGLVYNIESDVELADIITKTVYLKLLDFITKNNAVKDNK